MDLEGGTVAKKRWDRPVLLLILACACAQLICFAWLDTRPPNDHDQTFADGVAESVALFRSGSPLSAVGSQLRDGSKGWYPQLGAAWMVAWMGSTGLSRPMFRLATLPFLILLILGTFLASRELSGPRLALLSAWLVATAPMLVCFGRKWVGHYHAAALTPLGLWLGLRLLRSPNRAQIVPWFVFGLWQGLRVRAHPVVLADALLMVLLFPLAWWHVSSLATAARRHGLLTRLAASVGGTAAALLPLVIELPGPLAMSFSLPDYVRRRLDLVVDTPPTGELSNSIDVLASTFFANGMGWAFLGLLLLPVALRFVLRLSSDPVVGPAGLHSVLAAALAGTLLIQLPIAARAIANDGYGHDWQFLLPRILILAVWLTGRVGANHHRLRGAWVAAFIAVGLTHSFGPLAASARGPDAVAQEQAWASTFWEPWHHARFGTPADPYNSHLMVSRQVHGGEVIARAIKEGGHRELGVIDLTWHVGEAPDWSCELPSADSPRWQLGYPVQEQRGNFAVWPFYLNGVPWISTDDATLDSALFVVRIGPTWTGATRLPEELCANEAWKDDVPSWARETLELRFPGVERFEELWNPNGSIFGLDPMSHCWKRDCPPIRVFLVERPQAAR